MSPRAAAPGRARDARARSPRRLVDLDHVAPYRLDALAAHLEPLEAAVLVEPLLERLAVGDLVVRRPPLPGVRRRPQPPAARAGALAADVEVHPVQVDQAQVGV